MSWEKHHDRLERRRVARVAVTPEQINLTGCWQVLAIRREVLELGQPDARPGEETGYYVCSLSPEETTPEELGRVVRDHWSAIENGVHYRRDWTFREDACRVANRTGAEMLATLRNLAIGVYELELQAERTQADSLKNWIEGQTFSSVRQILKR